MGEPANPISDSPFTMTIMADRFRVLTLGATLLFLPGCYAMETVWNIGRTGERLSEPREARIGTDGSVALLVEAEYRLLDRDDDGCRRKRWVIFDRLAIERAIGDAQATDDRVWADDGLLRFELVYPGAAAITPLSFDAPDATPEDLPPPLRTADAAEWLSTREQLGLSSEVRSGIRYENAGSAWFLQPSNRGDDRTRQPFGFSLLSVVLTPPAVVIDVVTFPWAANKRISDIFDPLTP